MYSKKSTEKLDRTLAKSGAVVILPDAGKIPNDALVAFCDGCGAQLWIPSYFKDFPKEDNCRTFCSQCIKNRKIIK